MDMKWSKFVRMSYIFIFTLFLVYIFYRLGYSAASPSLSENTDLCSRIYTQLFADDAWNANGI